MEQDDIRNRVFMVISRGKVDNRKRRESAMG